MNQPDIARSSDAMREVPVFGLVSVALLGCECEEFGTFVFIDSEGVLGYCGTNRGIDCRRWIDPSWILETDMCDEYGYDVGTGSGLV